jgi:ABC-type branched-subunit amino acid transport system ATPase component
MTPALVIRDVSKTFGSVRALDDVSLDFDGAGITGIIGPNGSGKSTLVNIVTGVLRPSSGTVVWEGRSIAGAPPYRILRRGIARTFQEAMTFPALTVEQNLVVSLEAAGRRPDIAALVREGDFEPLVPHLHNRAGELPFGLARLLGIAVAMSSKPRLLLLDEPAAGLNDVEARELAATIETIRDSGTAVVMIDHDMAFLLPLCERVVVLDAGSVLADGPPNEIRNDPRVIATYLGSSFAAR